MINIENYIDKFEAGCNIIIGNDMLDGGSFKVVEDKGVYTITYYPPEIDQKENNCEPIELLTIME
jgi:hypothetical protein